MAGQVPDNCSVLQPWLSEVQAYLATKVTPAASAAGTRVAAVGSGTVQFASWRGPSPGEAAGEVAATCVYGWGREHSMRVCRSWNMGLPIGVVLCLECLAQWQEGVGCNGLLGLFQAGVAEWAHSSLGRCNIMETAGRRAPGGDWWWLPSLFSPQLHNCHTA